ncbi:MAG: DMT family transporter, partial [Limisphaerales bacterium]
ANFWRLAVATGFLAIWAHTFGLGLSGAGFSLFFLSGVIGIGLGDVALFQSLPRLGSRLSILLVQCLSAPFAALTEFLWLGTRLTPLQLICGGIILCGVSLALSPGQHLNITRRQLVVGVIFGTVAALGNAVGAVFSRKGFAVAEAMGQDIDGATTAYQRLIGGLLVGGLCLLVVKRGRFQLQQTFPAGEKWKNAWKWVLLNAIAGQTIGVSFYQLALKTAPTGIVLAITSLTPLMVIPFACYFENEKPQPRSIYGGILAVLGVLGLIYSKYF